LIGPIIKTPTLAVYGETGRFPLHVRQQMRVINYWLKLEKRSDNSLIKMCLNFQKNIPTQSSWFGKIKMILHNNCIQLCELDSTSSINAFSKEVKVKLYQKYHDDLISEINDSVKQPKLRTYKLIKTDIRIEPYLLINVSKKMYTKIARFRTSSHNLRIETGRHENPIIPAENRICNKCNLNEVENEIHCLITCPNQAKFREDLYDIAKQFIDNFEMLNHSDKFVALMTSREPEILKCLGKFLVSTDV